MRSYYKRDVLCTPQPESTLIHKLVQWQWIFAKETGSGIVGMPARTLAIRTTKGWKLGGQEGAGMTANLVGNISPRGSL